MSVAVCIYVCISVCVSVLVCICVQGFKESSVGVVDIPM